MSNENENELTWESSEIIIESNNSNWKSKRDLIEFLILKIEKKDKDTKNFILKHSKYLIDQIYDLRSGYVNIVCKMLTKVFLGNIGNGRELNTISMDFLKSKKLIKGLGSGNSVIQTLTKECFKSFFQNCLFINMMEVKDFYQNNKNNKIPLVRGNVSYGIFLIMERYINNKNFDINFEDIEFFRISKEFFINDKNDIVRKNAILLEKNFERFEDFVIKNSKTKGNKILNKKINKKSLFDILNSKETSIKVKKSFFSKFNLKNFYENSKIEDLIKILEIMEENKNYEIKKFLTKLLKDFPINLVFVDLLGFLEKKKLYKNFIFSKFLQRVYKGSMIKFMIFHLKANSERSLSMLLKRFKIKTLNKIVLKKKNLCEDVIKLCFENILEKKNEDTIQKNFKLIEKMCNNPIIRNIIKNNFSKDEYILILEKNTNLFKKIFIETEETKKKEILGEEKGSNNSTKLEEEEIYSNEKNKTSDIFSQKKIQNESDEKILLDPKDEIKVKKETKMNGILSSTLKNTHFILKEPTISETTIDI